MRTSDFARFNAVMNGMGKVYEREIDGLLLDAYWLALKSWSLADFEAACTHLMTNIEFMPRPAAFAGLRRAAEMTPSEAWTRVLGLCLQWRTPWTLPEGRLSRAVEAVGGWQRIALAHSERDLPHIQRRFLTAYEELSDVEGVREALPQIASDETKLLESL